MDESLKKQINRIKGQLNGVDKMLEDCRDPLEIIQQINAVRAALSRLGIDILKNESQLCFNSGKIEDRKKLEEIISIIFKIT